MNDAVLRLRGRMLGVLGASAVAAACGPAVEPSDTMGGQSQSGSSASESGSSSSASSDTASGTATTTESSSASDTGWDQPDCGDPVSRIVCVPMGGSSTGWVSTTGETEGTGGTGSDTQGPGSTSAGPPAPTGTSGSSTTTGAGSCSDVYIDDYSFCVYERSEPFEMDGQCCAELGGYEHCCDGRPFFVQGQMQTAPSIVRDDWSDKRCPDVSGLSMEQRAALAQAWLDDAAMEHASVASFARFALQLLAVGAPPELLEDTQQAIADEIAHAKMCFGLASAYAGAPVGPGPLAVQRALDEGVDLPAIAAATVREGCIGETLAALHAEIAAQRARDPAVAAVLRQIARDESRHAELAWRFVAWALARGGEAVRHCVARAFTEHAAPRGAKASAVPAMSDELWRAHGRLPPAEQARLMERGRAEIVLPCAAALLGPGFRASERRTGDGGAFDRLTS